MLQNMKAGSLSLQELYEVTEYIHSTEFDVKDIGEGLLRYFCEYGYDHEDLTTQGLGPSIAFLFHLNLAPPSAGKKNPNPY